MANPFSVNVSTAAVIVRSPAPGEQIKIINTGTITAYLSNNASVTTTTGIPLTPGSHVLLFGAYNVLGASGGIYAITATGGTSLSVNGQVT